MSLREKMARYEKLTGDIAEHIPLGRLGGFLDGVDRGIEELEKIKREIHDIKLELDCDYYTGDKITRLIEKHIEELKGKTE